MQLLRQAWNVTHGRSGHDRSARQPSGTPCHHARSYFPRPHLHSRKAAAAVLMRRDKAQGPPGIRPSECPPAFDTSLPITFQHCYSAPFRRRGRPISSIASQLAVYTVCDQGDGSRRRGARASLGMFRTGRIPHGRCKPLGRIIAAAERERMCARSLVPRSRYALELRPRHEREGSSPFRGVAAPLPHYKTFLSPVTPS
jgi:hypothetical protein